MQQKDIQSTYKSNDTEEWLDRVWTRPIGYAWACFFRALHVHPNVVTLLSMIIGASSALLFAHGSYRTEGLYGLGMNIGAICLLAWANFYDSADGQLARMTGQKTQLGRILDGAASEVWFIPIYIALVYRFYIHHALEFQWLGIADTPTNAAIATGLLLLFVLYSGFVCHSGQCGLADYYRQIHLFFLKGEAGSELDNSAAQQRIYDATPWQGNRLWKTFLRTYIRYTRSQERRTPAFQRLMNGLRTRYGTTDHIPQEFRNRFRAQSLPLMKWTNILTFNTRAIMLYAVCLADLPWFYFLFEVFVMGALCAYMRRKHERICQALCVSEIKITLSPQGKTIQLNLLLKPNSIDLGEVVVKPKRERYRKKGNPAVEFVRNMIESRHLGDPRSQAYFSYDHYEKMFFAKNDYTPNEKPKAKPGKFDFLAEYIDTLESGVTILPVSEKERIERIYYRRQPKTEKTVVRGYHSSGIDEIFSSDGVRQFLEEVFREVDLFQNDIPLFLQRFVSPLSSIGPDYYKYYLLNRLPLIKKLKWREVFGFRGLWGNLTDKNNPRLHPEGLYRFPATTYEMNQTPYMEASVGIENIFKFLRVDYVWRLTYLEHEDIQKSGVRMTMVLSF